MNIQYQRGDVFRIQFIDNETLQTIKKADKIDEEQLTLGEVYTAVFEGYHADQELMDFAILGNKYLLIQVRIKKSEIDDKRISAKCVWKCTNRFISRPVNITTGYTMIISNDHSSYSNGDIVYIWKSPKLDSLEDAIRVRCVTIDKFPKEYHDIVMGNDVALPVDLFETLNDGKLAEQLEICSLDDQEFHCWHRYWELFPRYEKEIDKLYPLCTLKDRYGGGYSGGEWTAWVSGIDYIPRGVFDDDVECSKCWDNLRSSRKEGNIMFGVGDTVDEALKDLLRAYKS